VTENSVTHIERETQSLVLTDFSTNGIHTYIQEI
jgi:hypothetical protein